jgi:hypothetical protein
VFPVLDERGETKMMQFHYFAAVYCKWSRQDCSVLTSSNITSQISLALCSFIPVRQSGYALRERTRVHPRAQNSVPGELVVLQVSTSEYCFFILAFHSYKSTHTSGLALSCLLTLKSTHPIGTGCSYLGGKAARA